LGAEIFSSLYLPPPDTTPLGRIVNRFSGDLTTVDTAVAGVFSGTLLMFAQTVFNLGNIIAIFYYMAIPLVPLAIAYYKIQDFFRKSSVELQRLTSISKSPVLATFGEVLSGLATIRAYQVRCACILWQKVNLESESHSFSSSSFF
jgi:ABC-type multidrug transport system fused ATPase/permease subunit